MLHLSVIKYLIKKHLGVSLIVYLSYTYYNKPCQPLSTLFMKKTYDCLFFRHIAQNLGILGVYLWVYGCQLFMWLTLNFPDLCISVYIRTYTPLLAPACRHAA